jgi:hypothetical protein
MKRGSRKQSMCTSNSQTQSIERIEVLKYTVIELCNYKKEHDTHL